MLQKLFLSNTPVDLYRFVGDEEPQGRMILHPVLEHTQLKDGRMRYPDVVREKVGDTWIIFPKFRKGVSLFDGPAKFTRPGRQYRIPRGTQLPPGLSVSEDKLNEGFGYMHYSIMPRIVMAEMHFLFLLRSFAANAIPVT